MEKNQSNQTKSMESSLIKDEAFFKLEKNYAKKIIDTNLRK